jgi:hypothetical protein
LLIGHFRFVHIERLHVLLRWGIVPVVHYIILHFSFGKGASLNKDQTRRSFLFFKV